MSVTLENAAGEAEAGAPSRSKQALRLWLRLLRCTTIVEKTVQQRLLREFGATLPRFDVLATLHRHPSGMTMSELSEHLLVSNGNVTGLVSRLQEDGLVNRKALAEDRRSYRVSITARGRRVFESMAQDHEQWIGDLFGGLTNAEIRQLLGLLARADRSVQKAKIREAENDA